MHILTPEETIAAAGGGRPADPAATIGVASSPVSRPVPPFRPILNPDP